MMTLTRTEESTAVATSVTPTLLLAFELGERTWKLGFTTGLGQQPRIRQIPAGDRSAGGGTRARESPVQVAGRCAGHELL